MVPNLRKKFSHAKDGLIFDKPSLKFLQTNINETLFDKLPILILKWLDLHDPLEIGLPVLLRVVPIRELVMINSQLKIKALICFNSIHL